MSAPFRAAGLGRLPTHRSQIPVELLLDVVTDVAAELTTGTLRIAVLDPYGSDPMLSVEDGERRVRLAVAELARDMELAHVEDSADGVAVALRAWLASRPVCDDDAAAAGIAVLGWLSSATVGWQVVLDRGGTVSAWQPSPLVDRTRRAVVRAGAWERSARVDVAVTATAQTVVWTAPGAPAFSTAALTAPDVVLSQLSRAGLDDVDTYLVLAPAHPFVAARPELARRLSVESAEPHVVLPWAGLASLRWG